MRTVLLLFAAVLAASPALPQTNKARTPKKKHAVTAKTRGKATRKTVMAPSRQATPTPDRYREIQQALVDQGYLKSAPSGVWDGASADAMKQFQSEHNLTATGKLSSTSLIALGLGSGSAAPRPVEPAPAIAAKAN
ncbi:MAG: peptidoglycan-binding protein [Acidobacteriota bacterium]|nr:peptidoglycan-binding protein [Acidobacteriota bacterium]